MIKKSYALLFLFYCSNLHGGNETLYTFKLKDDNNRIITLQERYIVYFKTLMRLITDHNDQYFNDDDKPYKLPHVKLSTLQTFKKCINRIELTKIYNNPGYTLQVIEAYLKQECSDLMRNPKNRIAHFSDYLTERFHAADYLNFKFLFSLCLHVLKKEMLRLRGTEGYNQVLNLNLVPTLSWQITQQMMKIKDPLPALVFYSRLQLKGQFKYYIAPRFIQLSFDGRTAVLVGKTVVDIWNFDDFRISRCYFSKKSIIFALLSQDGTLLAVATDHNIKIYDIELGEVIATIKTEKTVASLAFSLDNKSIVCGFQDGMLKIFGVAGDQQMSYFTGHDTGVSYIGILRDGKIITCSKDNTVRIWACDLQDFDTIECLHTIEYAALCATGQRLFISGRDRDNKMRSSYILLGTRMIYDLGLGLAKPLSITGTRFATLTNKSIRISRVDTDESYTLDKIKSNGYYSAAFSHDGYRAITSSGKIIKFWQNCTHVQVKSFLREVSLAEHILLRDIIHKRMKALPCSSKEYKDKLSASMIKNLMQWGIIVPEKKKKHAVEKISFI